MAHTVKVSKVDQHEQAESFSNVESKNPSLKTSVKSLCVFWHVQIQKHGQIHESLLLGVGTPIEANILVQERLLHDRELKDCELVRKLPDHDRNQ